MSSIWLKIAGIAVLAVVVIVVVGRFQSDKPAAGPAAPAESRSAERPRTFSDMADRDKQFATAPKPTEDQPVEQQPAVVTPPAPPPSQPPAPAPAQPVAGGVVLPSSITKTTTLYFKPLSEEDDIAAQQLLPWAATGRSIGRLPMMSYGPMVKACRDILTRWPDSSYAFQAKRMLEDISTSSRVGGFNITPQEMDISRFLKPRQGTQAIRVEPVQR
ncbi:MAG: hypothetical protein M1376_15820 [Planctomycetes bacterium]|nr:hypothetical protein [Planctomycetota bacterium]